MSKAGFWIVLVIVAGVATGGYLAGRSALREAAEARAADVKELNLRITALEKRLAEEKNVVTQLVAHENARAAAARASAPKATTAAAVPTKRQPALPNLNTVRAGGPKAVEVTTP